VFVTFVDLVTMQWPKRSNGEQRIFLCEMEVESLEYNFEVLDDTKIWYFRHLGVNLTSHTYEESKF